MAENASQEEINQAFQSISSNFESLAPEDKTDIRKEAFQAKQEAHRVLLENLKKVEALKKLSRFETVEGIEKIEGVDEEADKQKKLEEEERKKEEEKLKKEYRKGAYLGMGTEKYGLIEVPPETSGVIESKIQEESGGWEEQKVAWELGKSAGKGALKGGGWLLRKGGPLAGKGGVLGLAVFGAIIKDLWKLAKIEAKIAWKGITGHKVSLLEGWKEVFKKEEATK